MQILLQLLGFTLLSLSLSRHYSQVINNAIRPTKRMILGMRISGYILLFLAVFFALNSWGVALGLVYSFATVTLVATLLTTLLTYKPNYLALIIVRLKP